MKTNHQRSNRDTKHYHDVNDPWLWHDCTGHQGAARNKKGFKKAHNTASRRYAKSVLEAELFGQDENPHVTSTVRQFVKPNGHTRKRRGVS